LSYSDALFVTRVVGTTAAKAANTNFSALYHGKLGNSLQVSYCNAGNFNSVLRAETLKIEPSANSGVASGYTTTSGITAYANIGDRITLTNNTQLVISDITTVADAAAGSAVTFDGSSASVVVIASDTFVKATHGLTNGQAVQYSRGAGTAIEGLNEGGFYFVIRVAAGSFKLETTHANAVATTPIAINIVAIGAEPTHTVTPVTTYKSNLTFTSKYTGATTYESTFTTQWGDANLFDSTPSANGVHIVVRDIDGAISGTAGTVLERWENVSTSAGATKYDGSTNFIVDVLEQNSA
jgi:hypothetical protein